MSQVDYYTTERRSLWGRLFGSLLSRPEGDMEVQLPADSLFAGMWNGAPTESVADVPDKVKAQIREEALMDMFNRLEASLRLLLYATTPGKEPPTAERYQQILNVWRYELEHRVNLTPDTYCGAVQRYEPEMESAYTIDGRCASGDLLRIRVPCWRMHDRVVIRGEAELVEESERAELEAAHGLATDTPPVTMSDMEAPPAPAPPKRTRARAAAAQPAPAESEPAEATMAQVAAYEAAAVEVAAEPASPVETYAAAPAETCDAGPAETYAAAPAENPEPAAARAYEAAPVQADDPAPAAEPPAPVVRPAPMMFAAPPPTFEVDPDVEIATPAREAEPQAPLPYQAEAMRLAEAFPDPEPACEPAPERETPERSPEE